MPEILTVAELAALLKISRSHVYVLVEVAEQPTACAASRYVREVSPRGRDCVDAKAFRERGCVRCVCGYKSVDCCP